MSATQSCQLSIYQKSYLSASLWYSCYDFKWKECSFEKWWLEILLESIIVRIIARNNVHDINTVIQIFYKRKQNLESNLSYWRMREVTCGYSGEEPQVCCPTSAIRNSPEPISGDSCGQPLLHDWSKLSYQGLGAMPFVARIGFRSKLDKIFQF